MLQTLRNAFKVKDIRDRLLFVALILILYRIGAVMPVPFVNSALMNSYLSNSLGSASIFGYLNMLSGEAFGRATLFALSVSPYITASIVLQLLDVAFPSWFGGKDGRNADPETKKKKMTLWTRVVTVILAVLTSWGYYNLMRNSDGILTENGEKPLGAVVIIVCYCAGAALIMWLAEKIEEKGIGNGVSMILLANILSTVVGSVTQYISFIMIGQQTGVTQLIINIALTVVSLAMTLAIVVFVIWITGSERRIPIKYAKRVVGRKMYGGQSSHLPLKVNMSGVMPVIFASSIITLPATIIALAYGQPTQTEHPIAYFINMMFSPTGSWWSLIYMVLMFLLILGFSYFYILISFDPVEVSNNLQKQGGQIPGIRQGTPTAEYIKKILSKVTLMGAFFLSFIAVFPTLFSWGLGMLSTGFPTELGFLANFPSLAFGGTSLLIVIGVIQETQREIEAQLTMRNYKGFLNN